MRDYKAFRASYDYVGLLKTFAYKPIYFAKFLVPRHLLRQLPRRKWLLLFLAVNLLCHFLRKVLFLLLQTLAGLKADKSLHGKVRTVLLRHLLQILRNALLAVLSLYINLL